MKKILVLLVVSAMFVLGHSHSAEGNGMDGGESMSMEQDGDASEAMAPFWTDGNVSFYMNEEGNHDAGYYLTVFSVRGVCSGEDVSCYPSHFVGKLVPGVKYQVVAAALTGSYANPAWRDWQVAGVETIGLGWISLVRGSQAGYYGKCVIANGNACDSGTSNDDKIWIPDLTRPLPVPVGALSGDLPFNEGPAPYVRHVLK